jgi:nicotinamidase-related amidase
MHPALVVIDVQESFRARDYFSVDNLPAFLQAQNNLIAGFQARSLPIVRVLHSAGPPVASNPWSAQSGKLVPLQGLADFAASKTVTKGRHSALVGTDLEVWLREQGVGKLVISGIRTEQCCETTTRHASDIGFAIDYALDATLTFSMQLADGTPVSAQTLKAHTACVLQDRFAYVGSTEEVLQRL